MVESSPIARADRATGPVPLHETCLVVIGRGASDPDANANVSKVARMLWEGLGLGWCEVGYSGVAHPRTEVAARWDLDRLHDDVIADQARRRLVGHALRQGTVTPWEYDPPWDGRMLYMRNHLDLNEVERSARFPRPTEVPDRFLDPDVVEPQRPA